MQNIKEKTEYCLNCKLKPCSLKGCPLNNNIPDFIKMIKKHIKYFQQQRYFLLFVEGYVHIKNNVKDHV